MGSTHPPFDPELAPIVALLASSTGGSLTLDTLDAMRAGLVFVEPTDEQLTRGGTVTVEEVTIPGANVEIDLRGLVLRPASGEPSGLGVLYLHGGGMVVGSERTGLDEVGAWVTELGAVLVSVDYRLAPEHPHPTPVEDCYAALVWVADHAVDLGIDPEWLIVAGISAGGGLAAAVALLARDRFGPGLAGLVLLEPMLDDRCETPSSYELNGEGGWDRQSNLTGWTALLGDARGGPDVSPYAAPARADDLAGLPATYLDVGAVETFRDEVIDFAARLWRAGGDAELHVWAGAFHGFGMMAAHSAVGRAAHGARLDWLRRLTR